jgi:hypothetical protein
MDEVDSHSQSLTRPPRYAATRLAHDLRVLRLGQWLLLVYVGLQVFSILRLIGVHNVPSILLFTYRLLDLILIATFLSISGPMMRIRSIDTLSVVIAIYPALIGIYNENFNITILNDVAIYFSFVAKIILFRTILARLVVYIPLDNIFNRFSRRITWLALVTAIGAFIVAQALVTAGWNFYYQAPAEITLAAALAFAHSQVGLVLAFTMLAALSGKRMILVGVLAMAGLALLAARGFVGVVIKRLPIVVVLVTISTFAVVTTLDLSSFAAADKLTGTYDLLVHSFQGAAGLENFLALIDPGRYIEYLSLKPHLTGIPLFLGNGYGFRYELDYAFLLESGFEFAGDVSNAHFTPLAIVAKFGLLGLAGWFLLIVLSFRHGGGWAKTSKFRFACRLALVSLLVQSFFAFGFFINSLTPFLLAVSSIRLPVPVAPGIQPHALSQEDHS